MHKFKNHNEIFKNFKILNIVSHVPNELSKFEIVE